MPAATYRTGLGCGLQGSATAPTTGMAWTWMSGPPTWRSAIRYAITLWLITTFSTHAGRTTTSTTSPGGKNHAPATWITSTSRLTERPAATGIGALLDRKP